MLDVSMKLIWTVLVIGLAIVEGLTFGLTTIWFAIGALVALLAAFIGFNVYIQVGLFCIVSTGLLIFTRPITMKYLKVGSTKTNVDSLIGKRGIVEKTIDPFEVGQVKVNGQIWTAKALNDEHCDVHDEIEVISIEGVKLIVRRIEKEDEVYDEADYIEVEEN